MEVAFEIKPRQARENAVRDKELAGPEKRRSAERADQDDTGKIKQ